MFMLFYIVSKNESFYQGIGPSKRGGISWTGAHKKLQSKLEAKTDEEIMMAGTKQAKKKLFEWRTSKQK